MVNPSMCCQPLVGPALDAEQARQMAGVFKALADPARLQLLSMIAAHPEGEVCVCEMLPGFELSQPTISHHLRVLRQAGLVDCERRGTWAYYRVVPEAIDALRAAFTPHAATATR